MPARVFFILLATLMQTPAWALDAMDPGNIAKMAKETGQTQAPKIRGLRLCAHEGFLHRGCQTHKLFAVGVLAMLYAHTSARIGEAQDGLDNGVVNGLNALALAHGLQLDMRVSDAVRHLGG